MRFPQVTERVKEAPAQALRAVFAGIGQVLLVADRLKNRTAPHDQTHPTPAISRSADARRRSLDRTGNVTIIQAEDQAADQPEPAPPEPAPPEPAPPEPAPPEPAPPERVGLPVPNYDSLPLASLRARLRNLDSTQVRALLDYERAHAARPDVVAMFERRLAKLAGEG